MKSRYSAKKGLWCAAIVVAFAYSWSALAYTVPPTAPTWSANGNYQVNWTYQCSNTCLTQWLEEKLGSGSFVYVSGGTPKTYAGKPAGQYSYRLVRMLRVYSYYVTEYSSEVTVYVQPSAPPIDPLLTQRSYQYQTRVGDINGDGRKDLFINRVAGGVANNGVLEKLIVQQTATAGQYVLVAPSPAQASTASAWPVSSAQVAVEDINVDGFVDVAVKGVAGATNVSGAKDYIVYSPAQAFSPTPKGLRLVDETLLEFAGNMLDYQANRDFFTDNVNITYFQAFFAWSTCGGGAPVVSDDPIFVSHSGCVWVYQVVSGYYLNYSEFSGAAAAISMVEKSVEGGQITPGAGVDEAVEAVEEVLQVDIGGWDYDEVLGPTGPHDDPDYRRAMDIFMAVLGIGRAEAQTVQTDEAPPQAPRAGDAIYLTRRSILIFGNHVAFEHNAEPQLPCLVNNGVYCATISGFDRPDDKLTYVPNAFGDAPYLMQTLSTVEKPGTPTSVLWSNMLSNATRYNSNRVTYAYNCSGADEYNSNSFAHGLVYSVQANPNYDMNSLWPCGSKPVPTLRFLQ